MEEHVKTLERRLEEQNQSMQILMQWVKELRDCPSLDHTRKMEVNMSKPQNMVPKLRCLFDSTNPRIWIKKCGRYFSSCGISDDDKVSNFFGHDW